MAKHYSFLLTYLLSKKVVCYSFLKDLITSHWNFWWAYIQKLNILSYAQNGFSVIWKFADLWWEKIAIVENSLNLLFIVFRTFAAGNKIKQFYELLIEDSFQREDVENMSRENMKQLHEIMQSFRFSNVCFWSYLSRTILEIFLSIGLFLIYWCWGMPNLQRDIDCDVHGLKWVRMSVQIPNK